MNSEIPIGEISMREAIEIMSSLNQAGYETNVKSTSGRIVIRLKDRRN